MTAKYAGGELIPNPTDGELVWLTPQELCKLDDVLAELKPLIPRLLENSSEVISVRAVYKKGNELLEFEIEDPG